MAARLVEFDAQSFHVLEAGERRRVEISEDAARGGERLEEQGCRLFPLLLGLEQHSQRLDALQCLGGVVAPRCSTALQGELQEIHRLLLLAEVAEYDAQFIPGAWTSEVLRSEV